VLLNTAIVEDACRSGITALDLGESGGVAALIDYKERFGAAPVTYDKYRSETLSFSSLEKRTTAILKTAERLLTGEKWA